MEQAGSEWLRGRRAVVFGLARSGQAAVELLVSRGAVVTGVDEGEAAQGILHGDWGGRFLAHAASTTRPEWLDAAQILVLSPGIPTTHDFVRAAVARGLPVLSEIELAFRCSHSPVIAVTGSKGKSTTTDLIGCLLSASGFGCAVAGNIGKPYSAVVDTLGPHDWAVLELSSFQLETVDTFHAAIAVHLGLSPDHLDRYPDLESYALAKERIVRHQTAQDWIVVDPRDAYAVRTARITPARTVGYGVAWEGTGVERRGEAIVWRQGGTQEVLAAPQDVPLLGEHNLQNAMAALAVARLLGPLREETRGALRAFQALPFRMQPAGEIDGIRFVNDSKGTTVDAVRAGVVGLPGTLLLGLGGRNKGLDFSTLRPHLERVRAVLVFGEAAPEIETALTGAARVERVRDLDEMVARAIAIGRPGDTFLFSPGCTSFDMFRNAEHRGEAFEAAVDRARTRSEGAKQA